MNRTVLVAVGLSLTIASCSSAGSSTVVDTSTSTSSPSPTVTAVDSPTPTPSPTPTTLAQAYELVRSGVVRIDQTACDGSWGSGSGFLVAPDLVATVAHVVDGAHSLSVRVGKAVTHGTVVALDTKKDLALVRLKSRLPGHVLQWAPVPAVGAEVAVVGYPLGEPLTFTGGHVNAVDARLEMTDTSLTHMVKYDAATNGGNSGGPVVSVDGRVVGLVDIGTTEAQGESFAIAAAAAQDLIGLWMTSTDSVPLASCRDPWNDLVTVTSVHADAPAMAITFHSFFSGINEGDYSTSFGELTGAARGQFAGLGGFEQQYDGVTVSDVVIEKALLATNTSDLVTVSYREQFDDKGASTSSCKDFHVRYLLRNDTGWWVIDSVTQLKGSPSRC